MNTIISSKNNPIVKRAASLKEKKGRREYGAFLAEGEKLTAECLRSSLQAERAYVSENYAGKRAEEIFALLEKRGLGEDKITYLSESAFSFVSEEKTPQGVMLEVKIPVNVPRAPEGDCLILDGIADPGNLGTIIRTANAAGYGEIYLAECADAYSPKCVRASMSGIFFTKLYTLSREELPALFANEKILAADMGGEPAASVDFDLPCAIVIGAEGSGVSEGVRKAGFLGEDVMKYHKTLTAYVNGLLQNGFELLELVEPQPEPGLLEAYPEIMRDELRRPMMLLVSARKR